MPSFSTKDYALPILRFPDPIQDAQSFSKLRLTPSLSAKIAICIHVEGWSMKGTIQEVQEGVNALRAGKCLEVATERR